MEEEGVLLDKLVSPSSRRAWIEILFTVAVAAGRDLVALLAEGVDRNRNQPVRPGQADVALLAEGVDRNEAKENIYDGISVALLAEGVDRNIIISQCYKPDALSPSSRRAWIEICPFDCAKRRNKCRPPRGGRG